MITFKRTLRYGVSYANLLLTHSFKRQGRVMPRLKDEDTHAALIIPGFLGPRSVARPLEKRFEREGVPAFSFNLGLYSIMPMSMIVKKLNERMEKIRSENPQLESLDIIGHSMGGVIAISAIEAGVFKDLRIQLVTLGTPFQGTWVALFGFMLPGIVELIPFNPTIAKRNHFKSIQDLPFLSIAGNEDVLAPSKRCQHPAARFLEVTADHLGLIFKKHVFMQTLNFLKHA